MRSHSLQISDVTLYETSLDVYNYHVCTYSQDRRHRVWSSKLITEVMTVGRCVEFSG